MTMNNFVLPRQDITIDMTGVNGIVLDFSGGPDSALLGYMFAHYKNTVDPNVKLKFVNWQAKDWGEYLGPRCQAIIDWIREENNDVEIELDEFVMDRSLIDPTQNWRRLDMDLIEEFEDELTDEYKRQQLATGIYSHYASATNVHMPNDIAIELFQDRYLHGFVPDRDHSTHTEVMIKTDVRLSPFANLFKTDLANMADYFGITDKLLELTNSCNRSCEDTTTNFHCKNCYNCVEREWAYGRY